MIVYFISLSTIISISLYLTPITGSINVGNFITKSIVISFYSTSLTSINYSSLYSLYVSCLFLRQDIFSNIFRDLFSYI
jgi:hypothetical protein